MVRTSDGDFSIADSISVWVASRGLAVAIVQKSAHSRRLVCVSTSTYGKL